MSGMISTSLIKIEPPGMKGASPNKTRKRLGMISTILILAGLPGMIGAKPYQDPKEVGNGKYKPYQDGTANKDRCNALT